jgi:alanyl-tRNA synthetase
VFVKTEVGFRYAISGENVRQLGQDLHAALGGKGGGKPTLVQGSVPAEKKDIEGFFRVILSE